MTVGQFKRFPPHWGNQLVPTSTKRDTLAGLAMYSASRKSGLWAQRAIWTAARLVGARAIPARRIPFQPPLDTDSWETLLHHWREEITPFDSFAVHRARDPQRSGLAFLLLHDGEPRAFVKLRGDPEGSGVLTHEHRCLSTVWKGRPETFHVVEPLLIGTVGTWHYFATRPLEPQMHRPPIAPPIEEITSEIRGLLAPLPKPTGTPDHWVPMHGDFTPWNLRQFPGRELFLLDWENAGWGAPGSDYVLYAAAAFVLGLPEYGEMIGPVTRRYPEATSFWATHWASKLRGNELMLGPRTTLARQMLGALTLAEQGAVSQPQGRLEGLVSHSTKRRIEALIARTPRISTIGKLAPTVLCYHSVSPTASFASVSPRRFEEHLEWLHENCDVVPLADAVSAARREAFDRPVVAITFDDGHADNFTNALPALHRHDLPATFFLTTGLIDRDAMVLNRFSYLLGVPTEDLETLTWDQVRELSAAGMTIGAHSHSHPNLMRSQRNVVLSEMIRSKESIEDQLNVPITWFAYPFGKPRQHVSNDTADLAATAGFDLAVTTLFRRVKSTDPALQIPRFHVTGDSLSMLASKVLGKLDIVGQWQERAPLWAANAISDDVSRPR